MAIPNISTLLEERESRRIFQFSRARAQQGIATFNNLAVVPANVKTGVDEEGFIFGRDVWGVGVFSDETSSIGAKYGIE